MNMVDEPKRRSDGTSLISPAAADRISRMLWNIAGTLFLSLGIAGIVIPLLPATPFLLLAAACYLRGSAKMYRLMLTNRYFGKYLENYRAGRGLPLQVKLVTITFLWAAIAFSAIFATSNAIVRIILVLVAIGVTMHILTLKTKKEQ